MTGFEQKSPIIYVVCVPKKYEIGSKAHEEAIREVLTERPAKVYLLRNSRGLDNAMKTGLSVERVFQHMYKNELCYIQQVWIVGGGSSMYAREVVRLALSPKYNIPVIDRTPAESCFRRYVCMLRDGKEISRSKTVDKKLLLISS